MKNVKEYLKIIIICIVLTLFTPLLAALITSTNIIGFPIEVGILTLYMGEIIIIFLLFLLIFKSNNR